MKFLDTSYVARSMSPSVCDVSKSKSPYTDMLENVSPLMLGAAIRSHKGEVMINKRITSTWWHEFNHGASKYYSSVRHEEILSVAMASSEPHLTMKTREEEDDEEK